MDCQTARQFIDMSPTGASCWRSAEGAGVQEHVAACPQCQAVADDATEWHSRLHTVMTAVLVPNGVRERLLAELSKPAPQSATSIVTGRTATRHTFQWVLTGLSLSVALLAGLGYWISLPSQMQLVEISESAVKNLRGRPGTELSTFDRSFTAELMDAKWRGVCDPRPVGWDLDERAGHDVAAFRVNIPSLRFRGWLVMIPLSRIADTPSSVVPAATSYSQAAWHDEKYVYVCVAEQGSIESLVAQWNGEAA